MTDTTPHPVVVYGTGAVGGVIAAQLRLGGFDVTAVARGDHLRAIRAGGLKLVTQAGERTVPLPAAADAGEVDWSDEPVVILAVKSHQTGAALDDLATHAPAHTAIFAAQNGVANEMAILRRFADVYGVTVMLPAAHLEPGVVVQQSHPLAGILDLGRYPSGADAVAHDVAAMLRASQFLSEVRPDIMAWKHRKLIMNLGNGVTAIFRPGPPPMNSPHRHARRPKKCSAPREFRWCRPSRTPSGAADSSRAGCVTTSTAPPGRASRVATPRSKPTISTGKSRCRHA